MLGQDSSLVPTARGVPSSALRKMSGVQRGSLHYPATLGARMEAGTDSIASIPHAVFGGLREHRALKRPAWSKRPDGPKLLAAVKQHVCCPYGSLPILHSTGSPPLQNGPSPLGRYAAATSGPHPPTGRRPWAQRAPIDRTVLRRSASASSVLGTAQSRTRGIRSVACILYSSNNDPRNLQKNRPTWPGKGRSQCGCLL